MLSLIWSRFRRFTLWSLALVAAILCLSPLAGAQNLTGELDGTVRDATGSLVPNAAVTITNADRKQVVRTLTTNSEGGFAAPQLETGKYAVAVTSPGFKQAIITAEVHEGQSSTLAFALQTGAVQETVMVTADPLTPQLENAAASSIISGTQVRELSLSSRNFTQLLNLQPGISGNAPGPTDRGNFSPSGATNQVQFSVNGQNFTQNGYFLDGQDMINHGGNAGVIIYPSLEFLQEISLLRNTYGAQYGGSGGAVFNNATKGGGTDFHGGFYDFARSQIFNANTYFNKLGGIARPPIRYNDFGYYVGGPLWIPGGGRSRANAKTFFFAGQQFLRELQATSESISNIPTLAQRQGTFSHPVCVAYNGTTCTKQVTQVGGAGSMAALDPVAAAYLTDVIDKAPLPNNPTDPQGILFSAPGTNNESEVFARIDRQATKKLGTFFRYIHDPFHLTVPNGFQSARGVPGVGTSTISSITSAYLGHAEYTLSGKTVIEGGYGFIVNEVRVGVIGELASENSPDVRPTLPFVSTVGRIPSLTINGTAWTATNPLQHQHTNQVFVNVTHVAGKQTLYFGGSLEVYLYDKTNPANNAGAYTFAANSLAFSTGSAACKANASACTTQFEQAFGQFLTGQVSTFTQNSVDPANSSHNSLYEGYFQDDYRPTSRLTINAGMRYFFKQQPLLNGFDNYPKLTFSNFDPATYSAAAAPTIDSTGKICTAAPCPGGKAPNPAYNPNNGLIFAGQNSPFGQTILSQPNLNFAPRLGFAYDVFGNARTSIRGGYGIYYVQLSNSIFQLIPTANPPNATVASLTGVGFNNTTASVSNSPVTLTTIDPNAKTPYIQDYDLDVQEQFGKGYLVDIGYFGNHQVHQLGQININQPTAGAYVGKTSIAAGGVTAANSTILNVVRPYQGWASISETAAIFSGNYNSMQASLTKHLTGKSQFNVSYTFSKGLSNTQGDSASPQDINNLAAEYGPTNFNRKHIFSANFVYEEPFFRNSEAFVRTALAGWEVSGIISAGSGLYFTEASSAQDPAGLGLLASGAAASARPDQLANPNNGPHTVAAWFKTNAFANVPAGTVRAGNAPVNSILGPGYQNWDTSVFKNFSYRDRLNLQLRAEAFNVFNHTNFTTINTTLNNSADGTVTAAASNRILQFGAKVTF